MKLLSVENKDSADMELDVSFSNPIMQLDLSLNSEQMDVQIHCQSPLGSSESPNVVSFNAFFKCYINIYNKCLGFLTK